MKPIALLLLLSLASCASKEVKKENDEFAWIENADFTPPKEVPYSPSQDNFQVYNNENTILRESISRAEPKHLKVVEEKDSSISRSVSLCYQKRFDEAFKTLDQLYDKYRSNPSYWNQVGTCYYMKGDSVKANLYYNKALSLKKTYVPALNNIGVVLASSGKTRDAIESFKKAHKIEKFLLTPTLNLSQMYLAFGLPDKALPLLEGVWRTNKRDTDVLSALATAHLQKRNFKQCQYYYGLFGPQAMKRADIGLNYSLCLHYGGNQKAAQMILSEVQVGERFEDYYREVRQIVGGLQ